MVAAPQLLPAVTNGLLGMPAVHTSCVQALPSTGRSKSSLPVATAPWPSQTFFLQSRGVCAETRVPAAVLLVPHWPAMQLRVWQSASVPGQVLADRHSTQWEAPSQTRLPPQTAPDATGRWEGVPELHSSVVHTLPSTGRSVLSLNTCALPAPSHCKPLQSAAVGSTSLVPAAVKLKPHTPLVEQVRVRQAVSLPGQSAATVQPMHWPVALQ